MIILKHFADPSKNFTKSTKGKLFYGGRTCQVGSVGRSVGRAFFVFVCFVISGSKNDPKNKQTKIGHILQKILENILTYFQKFSAKKFRFCLKMAALQDFGKIKKKRICQNGIFGSVVPIKQVVLFCFCLFVCLFVCLFFLWPKGKVHSKLKLSMFCVLSQNHFFLERKRDYLEANCLRNSNMTLTF